VNRRKRLMKIKEKPEDFIVEEITPDGQLLEVGQPVKWKGGKGDYLVLVLEKKNWNTMGALKELSKRLHVSRKRLSFAGTKDRRAVTTQRVSVYGVSEQQLQNVGCVKDLDLRPLEYSEKPVKLGDLSGNRFTITLKELKKLKKPGEIPNFFGPQRFGEARPITHLVGRAIVNEQYAKAVETYLWKSFPEEPKREREARKKLSREKDFQQALSFFPKHLKYERTLLSSLAKNPKDYVGALNCLPRKLLLLFVHAYQSFLFNQVLEERLNKGWGLKPVKGDLLEDGVPTAPLYGFESELASGEPGEIEERVLEREWLSLKDFEIHGMPFLSSPGMRRKISFQVRDFEVLEQNKSQAKIRFSLPPGVYATTALDYLAE
jgi:tRNA pseudouridine13 synthase